MLAHDPYFLRDLRDELKVAPASLALTQLVYAANDYTTFGSFDPDKECESEFARHHRLLTEFDATGSGDAKPVATAIRLMLEAHLFRRFPNQLPKGMMFGQLINHIRDTPAPSPLSLAHNIVAELHAINDYAGLFHHDTNPDGYTTIRVVVPELRGFIRRALHIVHGGVATP